jgi:hypothetical protein
MSSNSSAAKKKKEKKRKENPTEKHFQLAEWPKLLITIPRRLGI